MIRALIFSHCRPRNTCLTKDDFTYTYFIVPASANALRNAAPRRIERLSVTKSDFTLTPLFNKGAHRCCCLGTCLNLCGKKSCVFCFPGLLDRHSERLKRENVFSFFYRCLSVTVFIQSVKVGFVMCVLLFSFDRQYI